jgi:twitching motility two-component system response regulator PilH
MGISPRILVADDDKLMQALLGDLLAQSGCEVLSAWDGEEALAKVRSESPDLILLDILMPKRNGIQVARDLKRAPATRDIPVVIVSSLAGTATAQVSKAEAYVQKPIDPHSLMKTVWELLASRRYAPSAVGGSSPTPQTSPEAAASEPRGGAAAGSPGERWSLRPVGE